MTYTITLRFSLGNIESGSITVNTGYNVSGVFFKNTCCPRERIRVYWPLTKLTLAAASANLPWCLQIYHVLFFIVHLSFMLNTSRLVFSPVWRFSPEAKRTVIILLKLCRLKLALNSNIFRVESHPKIVIPTGSQMKK